MGQGTHSKMGHHGESNRRCFSYIIKKIHRHKNDIRGRHPNNRTSLSERRLQPPRDCPQARDIPHNSRQGAGPIRGHAGDFGQRGSGQSADASAGLQQPWPQAPQAVTVHCGRDRQVSGA